METGWTQVIGKMTFGIYVLTTAVDQKINGMIASWVSMVSYDPPLVMVAVHPNRYSHQLIEKSGHFVLNILLQDQKAFLSRFKGADPVILAWPEKMGCLSGWQVCAIATYCGGCMAEVGSK